MMDEMTGITPTGTPGYGPAATIILTETYLQIIYSVIGSLGLIGNSFVIIVIMNYKTMRRKKTNTYIINQSSVDCTASFFLIVTHVFENHNYHKFDPRHAEIYCKLWLTKIPLWSVLVSSSYNLVSLTFEPYAAVVHPIWHKTKLTKAKVMTSIILAWTKGPAYNLAFMIPSATILDDGSCTTFTEYPNEFTMKVVGVTTFLIFLCIPLSFLIYTRMALSLRTRVTPGETGNDAIGGFNGSNARATRNVVRTLWIVGGCYICCWIWNQFFFLLFSLGVEAFSDFSSNLYHFTVIMVSMNCCINPLIYALNYKEFQRGMENIYLKCCPSCVKWYKGGPHNRMRSDSIIDTDLTGMPI